MPSRLWTEFERKHLLQPYLFLSEKTFNLQMDLNESLKDKNSSIILYITAFSQYLFHQNFSLSTLVVFHFL